MLAGVLLGLAASASWALANVAVQRSGRAVGPLPGLLWTQIIGIGMALVGTALFGQWPTTLTAGDWAWIGVGGASGLLGYVSIFHAFEHGDLTVVVPIISSWAVLSAGVSVLFFDERLTANQLIGAASVIAGAIVVTRYVHAGGGTAPAGGGRSSLWAAVGASVGFGIAVPAIRRLSGPFGPVAPIGVIYAADLVLALPLVLAFRIKLPLPRGRAWLPLVLAGFLETAGSVCITFGARHAPLAIVSPLASLAAAFTVLFAWVFLGERPTRGVLVGAALVSAGVVVLAL
jgi:drug/metabolite transporter (DMT)-like permease